VDFDQWNNIGQMLLPNTLSNAKMVYILNVDLDEWNNIGIHDFSS